MLIHRETLFFPPSYLYCTENGRRFSLLAAVALPKREPDKFSPGSMSDGTDPTSALLLARTAFSLAARGQRHPGGGTGVMTRGGPWSSGKRYPPPQGAGLLHPPDLGCRALAPPPLEGWEAKGVFRTV